VGGVGWNLGAESTLANIHQFADAFREIKIKVHHFVPIPLSLTLTHALNDFFSSSRIIKIIPAKKCDAGRCRTPQQHI
jgi:hypothetical protein